MTPKRQKKQKKNYYYFKFEPFLHGICHTKTVCNNLNKIYVNNIKKILFGLQKNFSTVDRKQTFRNFTSRIFSIRGRRSAAGVLDRRIRVLPEEHLHRVRAGRLRGRVQSRLAVHKCIQMRRKRMNQEKLKFRQIASINGIAYLL